jgi:hypothetical protein
MPLYLPAGDGIQAVGGGIKRVLGYMVGTVWREKAVFKPYWFLLVLHYV